MGLSRSFSASFMRLPAITGRLERRQYLGVKPIVVLILVRPRRPAAPFSCSLAPRRDTILSPSARHPLVFVCRSGASDQQILGEFCDFTFIAFLMLMILRADRAASKRRRLTTRPSR